MVVVAGCGRGETGRVAVKGTATYEGQPVAWGSIALRPAPGTTGPAAGTDIINGKFEIPANDGPATGSYIARIMIAEATTANSAANPLARGPHIARTFELPVDIETDREEYDLRLPADRREPLPKRLTRGEILRESDPSTDYSKRDRLRAAVFRTEA
jgi:hypothetical protein